MQPKLIDLSKIRVAAVNYLNTKPFLYGIKRHDVLNDMELVEAYPSEVARMILRDETDVALLPVAVLPQMKEYHLVTDSCIGCDGPVASVGIFSEVPIENIERIYLDYQSRTSVMLARILLRDYWKKEVELVDAKGEEFRDKIEGNTAGVVIGDRALEQRLKSRYFYDLGEVWKEHTGLPFVFAAWVSNKQLPQEFVKKFTEANNYGLEHIKEVISENPVSYCDLEEYYNKNISYKLDEQKLAGLQWFLKLVESLT